MNIIKILTLSLFSFCDNDYDCFISVYHLPETLHDLPIELSVGYDTYRIEAGQTRVIPVYKNVLNEVCINSYTNNNQGHSSVIRFYTGSSGGKLFTTRRTVFENRPNLCMFKIIADEDCIFEIK